MIEIKAPDSWRNRPINEIQIFLAGTIDMGVSDDWQRWMAEQLKDTNLCLFNPRRDAWDSSWKQDINNDKFREQVEWELDAMEYADLVVFYFAAGSKSPITLMELGLTAGYHPQKCMVCCPEGYWRKGNVDILCERYNIRTYETLEKVVGGLLFTEGA
jgi:hypothetical protein